MHLGCMHPLGRGKGGMGGRTTGSLYLYAVNKFSEKVSSLQGKGVQKFFFFQLLSVANSGQFWEKPTLKVTLCVFMLTIMGCSPA